MSHRARTELTRRMIVTVGGLTLLTACSGKGAPSANGAGPDGSTSSTGGSLPTSGATTAPSTQSSGATSSSHTMATGPGPSQTPSSAQSTPGANGNPASPTPSGQPTTGESSAPTPGGSPQPPNSPSSSGSPQPPNSTPTSPSQPSSAPASNGKPQYYVHGDKAIALTIDDGPSKYTPQVLELLAHYGISATFCMLGSAAKTHTGLVQEVVAAGHQIANHTFTHADLSKMDAAAVRSEMTRANDALASAGARPPAFFRAPYGAWSPAVFQVCGELDLRPLEWSVDPKDWSRPGTDRIVDTVLAHTHAGSIILEHDGGGDRSQTVAALERFIPKLLAKGYHFVHP